MKQMTNDVVKIAGLVFLTFVFLSFIRGIPLSKAAEPIKIGAVLSFTGWGGAYGTAEKEAITIVSEEANRQGGVLGRQIEVYYEDDQTNPTNTAIGATKLIRDKKVCALIGASLTYTTMAVLPIVEQEEVLFMALAVGQEVTEPFKKWVFRVPCTDKRISAFTLKDAIEKRGARKIAILYSADGTGVQGAKAIQENIGLYSQFNATIVITEQFDPKDTNVTPQLMKIKAARADAILLMTTAPPGVVVAKNYHQLGLTIPVYTAQGVPTPEFLKLAGQIVEGKPWIFRTTWCTIGGKLPPNEPRRVKIYDPFIKALKEKYPGAAFSSFHGNGHDSMHMLIKALKIAGTDNRAELKNAMEKVEHQGLIGNFKYSPTDHDGLGEGSTVPMVIKNNEFWPIQ